MDPPFEDWEIDRPWRKGKRLGEPIAFRSRNSRINLSADTPNGTEQTRKRISGAVAQTTGLATTRPRLLFLRERDVAKVGCLFHLEGNQISQRISWAKGRLPGRHLKKDFSSECSDFADEHYRYRSRSRSSQIRCKSSSARTRPTTHPGPLLLPCPKLFVDLRNRSIMSKKSAA